MTPLTCRLANGERTTCLVARIRSDHQTYLDFDPVSREISHRPASAVRHETFVLTWSLLPEFALLVSSRGDWPEDMGLAETWSPGFFPLASIDMQAGRHALKPYGSAAFLTAEVDTGRVLQDRKAISDWELFDFEPLRNLPPLLLSDFAEQFAAILSARHDARAVLAALLDCPTAFQPDLLEVVLTILHPRIRSEFIGLFVADLRDGHDLATRNVSRLLATLPQGQWVADALQDLHDWKSGKTRSILRAGPNYDFMGLSGQRVAGTSYHRGARLLEEARRAVVPRRNLALLATARDEGLYLLEWIAHHRRIGVEQFFIYTNDLTDGSDVLLRRLAEAGEIVWIDNSGDSPARINMQDKAYYHALTVVPELLDYRWCLVVDLDEMVLPGPHVDYRLPPLLDAREQEGADAVAMSWRVFNSSGHLTWTPGLSSERFVETERHPLIKSVFRTGLFSGSAAHHPVSIQRQTIPFLTIDGEAHREGDLETHDINFATRATVNAVVCHYHVRSLEEYVWKFARGENDGNGVLTTKHFRYNNPGIFELFTSRFDAGGPKPALPIAEDIRRGMRRLLRLPGVSDAQRNIEAQFARQSVAFVEQSAAIMKEDDRIAPETRARWCALVDLWREARGVDAADHNPD